MSASIDRHMTELLTEATKEIRAEQRELQWRIDDLGRAQREQAVRLSRLAQDLRRAV